MTLQTSVPAQAPLHQTLPSQPAAQGRSSDRQVGKSLDPAQLKQVGGGNASTPVRRW